MLDGKIGNEKVGLAWNTNYWLEVMDMELLGVLGICWLQCAASHSFLRGCHVHGKFSPVQVM